MFALLAGHHLNKFHYTFKPKEYFLPLIGQLFHYQLLRSLGQRVSFYLSLFGCGELV